jgi:hypothetical protein
LAGAAGAGLVVVLAAGAEAAGAEAAGALFNILPIRASPGV